MIRDSVQSMPAFQSVKIWNDSVGHRLLIAFPQLAVLGLAAVMIVPLSRDHQCHVVQRIHPRHQTEQRRKASRKGQACTKRSKSQATEGAAEKKSGDKGGKGGGRRQKGITRRARREGHP